MFFVCLCKIFIVQYHQLPAWLGSVFVLLQWMLLLWTGCFNETSEIFIYVWGCQNALFILTCLFCLVFSAIAQFRDDTHSAASAVVRHTSTQTVSICIIFLSTFHERHWQTVLNLLSSANVTSAFLCLDRFYCETIDKYGFAFQVCSCFSKQQDCVIL